VLTAFDLFPLPVPAISRARGSPWPPKDVGMLHIWQPEGCDQHALTLTDSQASD